MAMVNGTPDGISADDWDRVKDLAAEVVNLSGADRYEASDRVARELVDLLLVLERKYGPLPSLLATRADSVESTTERENLLLAAYYEAERRTDVRNQVWIAHSLASHFIDGDSSDAKGERWLLTTQEALAAFEDDYVEEDLHRLRAALRRRRRGGQQRGGKGRRTRGWS